MTTIQMVFLHTSNNNIQYLYHHSDICDKIDGNQSDVDIVDDRLLKCSRRLFIMFHLVFGISIKDKGQLNLKPKAPSSLSSFPHLSFLGIWAWLNDFIQAVIQYTQQTSYSISNLRCTVTTWWLDSDSVVTIVNCQQHSDYTVDRLSAAGSCQQWLHHHCVVTMQHRWLMEKVFCRVTNTVPCKKNCLKT